MSFSILTNVASLQAQKYLNNNQQFQNQTINEVTSGLRIVNSGDDAAGLAIANGYRSDEAVLTQGIQNANNGLAQLQIADGGMNNISQLLDRASTLATESATGTFTGDRNVLNSEFQSVLTEINRQAQAIGLNTGGQFAKNLQVYIGGGEASNGTSAITNGSVSVDLSRSTVDNKSLGLMGVQSIGVAGTDIGNSSATSVSNILGNATNSGSEANQGYTTFYINGPGFSGANKIAVNVNLAGVTDGSTLVTAINNAIQAAGQGNTQYATAFSKANITAALNTDSNGKTQLTFASSNAAFQVQAGDRMANALMGNFSSGSTGAVLATTVSGAAAMTAATAVENNVQVQIQGAGMSSPQTVSINISNGETVANMASALQTAIAANSSLTAAGVSVTNNGGTLQFSSTSGKQFAVQAAGDTNNFLGLGSFIAGTGNAVSYTSITAGAAFVAPTAPGTGHLEFSLNGGASNGSSNAISIALATTDTESSVLQKINNAIAQSSTLEGAGLEAVDSSGSIEIQSGNGTKFSLNAYGFASTDDIGFGHTSGAASFTGNTASAAPASSPYFDAQGAVQTGGMAFNPVVYGSDKQTLSFSATDSSGAAHTVSVILTSANAGSLDQALSTINTALQATNDSTLQQIVAVGEDSSGTQQMNFVSNLNNFNVTVGNVGATAGTEGVGNSSAQGTVVAASQVGSGGTANVSNQAAAEAAVTALSNAVSTLGSAQAAVGKGENLFTYATNLAQSQLTNTQSAESTIRDANLAQEAANLTKAQILIQAGVAALAQANSAPQQILSLLSGH